jgi:hypothetical protein
LRVVLLAASAAVAAAGGGGSLLLGACGPFTDVSDAAFCPFVLEIFTLGITTGVTPTTYEPATTVNRLQMAAFLSRTVDGVLKRSSPRAAAGRYWKPGGVGLGVTTVGTNPDFLVFDGLDVWVSNFASGTISRVRSSSGNLLGTWTGATSPGPLLSAMGAIFASSHGSQNLYRIDPKQATNAANIVATVAIGANDIAFDGERIWLANQSSISIVTPGPVIPWTVTTVTAGFSQPTGAVYDGSNVWVTDAGASTLLRLNSGGAVLQSVTVGEATHPVFDGQNIWAPNPFVSAVTVVRASSGAVLRVVTGNGLFSPITGAFDGERVVLVSNTADTVSIFKAADLSPLGSFSTGPGTQPFGVCSDGIRFWVALYSAGKIAQF